MQITGILWLRNVVDKLAWKHNVTTDEVEEIFNHSSRYRFIEAGDIQSEDLYTAHGRTSEGRYLTVYFIYKSTREALIVSAHEMKKKERKSYGKK